MLARKQVDAIVSFHFVGQLALNVQGIKDDDKVIMRYADHGAVLYGSTVIVNPRFAQENPEAVRAFLRALTVTIKDVIADPAGSIASVRERDGLINDDVELRRLKICLDSAVVTADARRGGLGAINKRRLENTIDQVISAFGIKNPVSADGIFDSSYLPAPSARRLN